MSSMGIRQATEAAKALMAWTKAKYSFFNSLLCPLSGGYKLF